MPARKPPMDSTDPIDLGPPPLSIQPVCFCAASAEAAEQLALGIYSTLTRQPANPLDHGAGVWVREPIAAQDVDLSQSDRVVLVLVLSDRSTDAELDALACHARAWLEHPRAPRLCVVRIHHAPVSDTRVPRIDHDLEVVDTPADGTMSIAVIRAVVTESLQALQGPQHRTLAWVCHTHADRERGPAVAPQVHQALSTLLASSPFDLMPPDWLPDREQESALSKEAASDRLVVVVVGDDFLQDEVIMDSVLAAKAADSVMLAVYATEQGLGRASGIIGNTPSMLWRGDADAVALRAAVQWLESAVYRRQAERALGALGAPTPRYLSRPPELTDFVIGETPRSRLLMYPDPALSIAERRLLSQAHRRLHLLTPTTAYGYLQSEAERLDTRPLDTPLGGLEVGLSVSGDTIDEHVASVTECHLQDIVVHVMRALLASGARIAYGGYLKQHSYTHLLAQLVDAYGRSGQQESRLLSFRADCEPPQNIDAEDEAVLDRYVEVYDIAKRPTQRTLPPRDANKDAPVGLYDSEMRQAMCRELQASVVFGGSDQPRAATAGRGYRGRFPGILEEAWRMLVAEKPIYIVGGFGGAAGQLAALLLGEDGDEVPESLRDETWLERSSTYHRDHIAPFEHYRELRKQVGLPDSLATLTEQVRRIGRCLVNEEGSATKSNGLSAADNRSLMITRDPLTIASLILRGLCTLTAQNDAEDAAELKIELVLGSVHDSSSLDAVSVPVARGVPQGGAAADVDALLRGRLSQARLEGKSLLAVDDDEVPTDFVHLATLTPAPADENATIDIAPAIEDACAQARRLGLSRLGVALYGASLLGDSKVRTKELKLLIERMANGFAEHLPRSTTLVWHEVDAYVYDLIKDHLVPRDDVALTTVRTSIRPGSHQGGGQACLNVDVALNDQDDQLTVTVSPPNGTAIVARDVYPVDPVTIKRLGRGISDWSPPRIGIARRRGECLRRLLFRDRFDAILDELDDATEVRITHNARASRIPFELLTHEGHPITNITRRLTRSISDPHAVFQRRPTGTQLSVLVIANPGGDLPNAEHEGREVHAFLAAQLHVRSTLLLKEQADIETVSRAIGEVDILHYCGHGFFDEPGPEASGIQLAHDQWLRPQNLSSIPRLPTVAVFNACEGANIRRGYEAEGEAFAEHWLVHGLESYVSTTWEVEDRAALCFARTLYGALLENENLRDAVRLAREKLYAREYRDWCNYVLYGTGDFRLLDRVRRPAR